MCTLFYAKSLILRLNCFFFTFELRGFPFAYSQLQVKFAWITAGFRYHSLSLLFLIRIYLYLMGIGLVYVVEKVNIVKTIVNVCHHK